MANKDSYRLFVVGESDEAGTLAEMFERAAGGATWLVCKSISILEAWVKFVERGERANSILVHGSLSEGTLTGTELTRRLVKSGYRVNVYSVAGARNYELKQYQQESGVSGFTHAELEVMLQLLTIASNS